MLGKTHRSIGLTSALACTLFFDQDFVNETLFISASLFGSLLPDIDHRKSTINKGSLFLKIIGLFFKHRGITHSIIPTLIGTISLLYFWNNELYQIVFAGILFGMMTHVLSDCCTHNGVALFLPFSKKTFRFFWWIKTGGSVEKLINLIVIFLGAFLFYYQYILPPL